MAIEFRCATCNRLLRVGEDAAGKHAKCPECGTVLIVPTMGSPAAPPPQQAPRPEDVENPYRSPSVGPYTAAPAAPGEIRPTLIDINDVFSRTWAIFKSHWGLCLWVLVGATLLNFFASMLIQGVFRVVGIMAHDRVLAQLLSFLGSVAGGAFGAWLQIGQTMFFVKTARGRNATFSDVFSGGPYFLNIILASILYTLIVIAGFIMFIVPSIIFTFMFSQFYYLILDRNVGVMDSLKLSREVTTGNKLTLFVLGLLSGLLGVVVILLTCGVGLLAVAPFMALLGAVTYLIMTGQPTADQLPQAPLT